MHRLYDNQPQRKKGLDYHNNGPYITKRFSSLNSSATDINESMRTMIRHKIPGCKNYPKNVEKLDTLSFFKQSHKAHLQFQ